MHHFTSIDDLSREQIQNIFLLAKELKEQQKARLNHRLLKGKTLGMIFEKSSTRTRVSFEAGMFQLGGHALFLGSSDIQIGRGETIKDTAQVLSRYLDGIMIRTFSHDTVLQLAEYSSVPVINGLSDLHHPCQALADIMTIMEAKQNYQTAKLAYVGDGNNVAHSLLQLCTKLGMDISIATPEQYSCDENIVLACKDQSYLSGSTIHITNDPCDAVEQADVIYTDTWISMGQEDEKKEKIKIFKPYSVTKELLSHAKENVIFLHCLPAYRGYEVSSEVIDGPHSEILNQAENRLHVQKALMTYLMSKDGDYCL